MLIVFTGPYISRPLHIAADYIAKVLTYDGGCGQSVVVTKDGREHQVFGTANEVASRVNSALRGS